MTKELGHLFSSTMESGAQAIGVYFWGTSGPSASTDATRSFISFILWNKAVNAEGSQHDFLTPPLPNFNISLIFRPLTPEGGWDWQAGGTTPSTHHLFASLTGQLLNPHFLPLWLSLVSLQLVGPPAEIPGSRTGPSSSTVATSLVPRGFPHCTSLTLLQEGPARLGLKMSRTETMAFPLAAQHFLLCQGQLPALHQHSLPLSLALF